MHNEMTFFLLSTMLLNMSIAPVSHNLRVQYNLIIMLSLGSIEAGHAILETVF